MQKHWRTCVVALILVIALFAGMRSSNFGYCIENSGQYPADKGEKYKPPAGFVFRQAGITWNCIGSFTNENGAAITGIATILLAFITWRLVTLGREQSNTARAELRAYVTGKPRGLMLDDDGEMLSIFVEITNSGQTPAFDVTVPARIAIRPPPPHRFKIGAMNIGDDEIDSLATFTLSKDAGSVCAPKQRITYADRVALAASKDCLYVFGLIAYLDIFGDDQWAEFCAYLEGKVFLEAFAHAEKDRRAKIEISFKVAGFGNDASFRPGGTSKH